MNLVGEMRETMSRQFWFLIQQAEDTYIPRLDQIWKLAWFMKKNYL